MKILKLKDNPLVKNVGFLFSGTVISSVFGFLNMGLLIRSIGLEFNGIIFLSQSYVEFFNSLLNFQSFEAIIKYLPECMERGNERGKNYIKLSLAFDIITAIFSLVTGYLFLNFIGAYLKWDNQLLQCTKIILLTIPVTITGSFNGILRVYSKFKELSYANILITLITTIFYILGLFFKFSFEMYIIFIVVRSILKFLLDGYLVLKVLKENDMLDCDYKNIKYDKEFIKFAFYSSISKILDIPVLQLVPMVIGKYLGVIDVAIYKILEKLGSLVALVTGVIFQVIGPEISKKISLKKIEEAHMIVKLLVKIIFIVGIISIGVVSLTGKYWFDLLIPDYHKYIYEIYLYIIFVIFSNAFLGYHPLFLYVGFVKETTYLMVFVNTFYLVIIYYLIINFGLSGVIISRIIQSISIVSIKYIILRWRRVI